MHVRSRSTLRIALTAGLVLAPAVSPAQAQVQQQQSLAPRTPPADLTTPARTPAVGPTMEAASVGVRQPVTDETRETNAQQRRRGYGQPIAMMVVGGAALLAGLIISGGAGTAIAVGGAVVGLYGLYQYLQ